MPDVMVCHEGDADPQGMRILKVCRNLMELEIGEGGRVVVDTARRVPSAGWLFVLWEGDGLVVKRVEPIHGPGSERLRLLSAIGRVLEAEQFRAVGELRPGRRSRHDGLGILRDRDGARHCACVRQPLAAFLTFI